MLAYRFLPLGKLNLVRVRSKISRRVSLALRRAYAGWLKLSFIADVKHSIALKYSPR